MNQKYHLSALELGVSDASKWFVIVHSPATRLADDYLAKHLYPDLVLIAPCAVLPMLTNEEPEEWKQRKQKPAPSHTGSKWGRRDLRQVSDPSPHCYL